MSRVYMVEQGEQSYSRLTSAWATYALAEREVLRKIAEMPRASRHAWTKNKRRKRMSQHHGRCGMLWDARVFGPSTRHISYLAVVSYEINEGSAVERLAELVS